MLTLNPESQSFWTNGTGREPMPSLDSAVRWKMKIRRSPPSLVTDALMHRECNGSVSWSRSSKPRKRFRPDTVSAIP